MATQVNKKFVIGLSAAVIVGAAAVVGVGVLAYAGRAEKLVTKGDAFAAAGNWKDASDQYERAVGHDRTRTDWLVKWRDAMVRTVPESRPQYEKQYNFYRDILRLIAFQRPNDAAAQVAYIDELEKFVRTIGGGRENYEHMIKECDERMRGLPEGSPERNRIRKARALAMVEFMLVTTAEESRRDEAKAELVAVLEADPSDSEAADGLVQWYVAEAARLQREGKAEPSRAALDDAFAQAEAFLAAHPRDLRLALKRFSLLQTLRALDAKDAESARRIGQELQGEASKILALFAELGAESTIDPLLVERSVVLVLRSTGRDSAGPLLEVLNRQLERAPQDTGLMTLRAYLLRETGDFEGSLAQYQAIVDMPDPALSLEGFLLPRQRVGAVTAQINTAVQMWEAAPEGAEKEAALKRAKSYREALAARRTAQTLDDELMADARIAMAERRYGDAISKLGDLRLRPAGQTLEVMQLLAQALEMQNALGEARLVLIDITRNAPGSLWAQYRLGEVNLRLGNLQESLNAFNRVLELNPQNAAALERKSAVLTAMGRESTDPVIAGLMQARELRSAGDLDGALAQIEALRAKSPRQQWDRRLVILGADILLAKNDRAGAIALVDAAIEQNPDDDILKRRRASLDHEDPLEAALAQIDVSDESDLNKHIERFQLFVRTGDRAKAKSELDSAAKIAPDDQRVVDFQFVLALADRDFDTARAIAQKAASLNIDQANGLLYQGRIELLEGNTTQAIATLERAIQENQFNPAGRRLLAQALQRAGRVADALDAYKRAYEGRPDDPATARDYAEALIAANRGREALAVLNPESGVLQFAPEPDLIAQWLQLEARYGDRSKAIKYRQSTLERNPDDIGNAVALAQLYLDEKEWDKADKLISSFEGRKGSEGFGVAMLRAMWHGRQGEPDSGIAALRAYIESMPSDERTVDMYTGLSQYLAAFGRADEAAAALEQGRLHQHPLRLEADRTLGDYYFDRAARLAVEQALAQSAGRDDDAVALGEAARDALQKSADVYRRVITTTAGADRESLIKAFQESILATYPEDQRNLDETRLAARDRAATQVDSTRTAVIKRATETLLRLEKPAEARAMLAPLVSESPDDLQVLMLQAACADAEGNRREGRQMFDRAVQLYPNEPQTFYQRAVFNSKEPALLNDVLQDLVQCTRLRPGFTRAWIMRFELLNREGRADDAFAVLRGALESNPDDNELRATLVRRLAQSGRLAEAQEEALKAVEKNPDDKQWMELCARAMASFERWPQAADLYQRLYNKEPTPEHAQALLHAMLRPGVSFERQNVGAVLTTFETGDDEASVADLMLRARAKAALGQRADSDKLVYLAIAAAGTDAAQGRVIVDQLLLLKQNDIRDVVAFLDKASADNKLNGGMQVVRLRAKIGTRPRDQWPELQTEVLQLERQLTTDEQRLAWYSLIGQLHYMMDEFELAEGAYRKGLELNPDDVQMNNDLAYTLVAHLNRAKEAVPFAQRAGEHATDRVRSTVLDTLGVALQRCGQCQEAIPVLTEAVQFAQHPGEAAVAYAHLGQAYLSCADQESARRSLQSAENAARRGPEYRELYEGPMEALRKALE